MPRTRSGSDQLAAPEDLLVKATRAKTALMRARYARRGLELVPDGQTDTTTKAMLLRQLYLASMERKRFGEARTISTSMLKHAVLIDVAHQDAARACLGCDDLEGALNHLRMAARLGPASRRAFHLSMLGALLYLNGRAQIAVPTLAIAARWSTTDKPICRAQLALAMREAGMKDEADWAQLRDALERSSHHRGYGEYLLGELSVVMGDDASAQGYFEAFVERTTHGRVALAVALKSEIGRATHYLEAHRRAERV